MDLSDRLKTINKKIFEKRNIILITILSILLVIVYSCVNIINFTKDYEKSSEKNNSKYRELFVYNKNADYNKIRDIEHIEYYVPSKFMASEFVQIPEFNNAKANGQILIMPLINTNDISISKGKNLSSKNDIVCPEHFYPYDKDDKIYYNMFLKGSDYIGLNIKVTPKVYEKYEDIKEPINLQIVGTYKTKKFDGSIKTCYVNKEAFDYIKSDIQGIQISINSAGIKSEHVVSHEGVIVRVDEYENIDAVAANLRELGYSVDYNIYIDDELMASILYIPLFVALIIILIIFNIIYSFLNKKNKYRYHYYGLLKVSGYTNKDIKKINVLENTIICNISIIISLILYLFILFILKRFVLHEFTYNNYAIELPILYLLVIFILINAIFIIVSNHLTKKSLKLSVKDLLEAKI